MQYPEHDENFNGQLYLDYFRLHEQNHKWPWLMSKLKPWYRKADNVEPIWHHLNAINAICLPLETNWNSLQVKLRPVAIDCLTATTWPQWTRLLPYSEHWIVGLLIWLRKVGALPYDFIEAERFKTRYCNYVPLPIYLGMRMRVELGAFVFFPVKQCLWRLCLIYRHYLMLMACARQGNEMDAPQDWLKDNWKAAIPVQGSQYLTRYVDYDRKHRIIRPYGEATKSLDNEETNIYQVHFLVIKNDRGAQQSILREVYTDTGGKGVIDHKITFGRHLINEGTAQEMLYDNTKSRKIPQLTRSVFPRASEVDIAKYNELAGKYTSEEPKHEPKAKEEGRLDIGPTMYVPFDIIIAVAVAWKTIHRLCYLEGFYLDHHMTELMQLADYFLRLVQCQKASDVFAVQQPPAFEEPELSLPQGQTFESLNHTKRRRSPRQNVMEGETFEALQQEERLMSSLPPESDVSSGSESLPYSEISPESETYSESDVSPGSEVSNCGDDKYCPSHHDDKAATIDKLQRRLALKCLEMQEKVYRMEEEFGLLEALNQQRLDAVVGQDDQEVGRLWTEITRTTEEPACVKQRCFDDLRSFEEILKYGGDAQYEAADRLEKSTVISKWMKHSPNADPPMYQEVLAITPSGS